MITTLEKWNDQAIDLVYKRYLVDQNLTIEEWILKVTEHVTKLYPKDEAEKWASKYFDLIYSRTYLPTSACLHNSLEGRGSLAGCTVLPLSSEVKDLFQKSIPEIQDVLMYGTGVGIDLTVIPPRLIDDLNTKRTYPGPVETLTSIVSATDGILLYSGLKRAAFMASLYVNHPDIFEFIKVKSKRHLQNVNISVAVDDDFLASLKEEEGLIPIHWKHDGKITNLTVTNLIKMHERSIQRSVEAPDLSLVDNGDIWSSSVNRVVGKRVEENLYFNSKQLLFAIAEFAHECGDPGILNMGKINQFNPTHPDFCNQSSLPVTSGEIHVTTPCGEQPLLPYEVCHLGSFNLNAFVEQDSFNFDKLKEAAEIAVRFMDDVVEVGDNGSDMSNYMAKSNRKIGIGIMGLADVLSHFELPYDSEEARTFASDIVSTLQKSARFESENLAEERGAFIGFENSIYKFNGEKERRHATLTTIAPTGHISILADCSTSIEPYYLVTFFRNAAGQRLQVCSPLERKLSELNFSLDKWIDKTIELNSSYVFDGTLEQLCNEPTNNQDINTRLQKLKNVFRTAQEIKPIDHIKMVASLQNHVENGISKTINVSNSATVDDIYKIMVTALEYGLKGITVFRDGCLSEQALTAVGQVKESCPECGNSEFLIPNDCGALSCDSKFGGCGFEGACSL